MNTVSRFALAWPSYEKCNETEITTTWASRYGPFPPRRGGAHRLVHESRPHATMQRAFPAPLQRVPRSRRAAAIERAAHA